MLADAEWRTWGAVRIAETCAVGHAFVSRMKGSLSTEPATHINRHGSVSRMNTGGALGSPGYQGNERDSEGNSGNGRIKC